MVENAKSKLRSELRKSRMLLSEQVVRRSSQVIARAAIKLIDWGAVESIHCYAASRARNEPATEPILKHIWQNHPQIVTATPVVQNGQMASVAVNAKTTWLPNQLAMPEPTEIARLPADAPFDVIIVPLLGFNEQGFRIGYGGGNYDRFLATQQQALTIGLCYEAGFIEFEPEPHDIPLQTIVTEQSVRKFSRK